MKFLRALFILAATGICSSVHAGGPYAEGNKTVSGVGVRPVMNAAYFRVAEGLTINCYASVVWINLSPSVDPSGVAKTAYASVLSAQMAGKKLAYIDYSQNSDGNCWLNQVEVAP